MYRKKKVQMERGKSQRRGQGEKADIVRLENPSPLVNTFSKISILFFGHDKVTVIT
jgi:hypothetical protein